MSVNQFFPSNDDLNFNAHFQCSECGQKEYSLDEVVYTCSVCGGLLEVVQDLEALGQRSKKAWKHIFDSRLGSLTYPYSSGVWNKKELVLPQLQNENVISLGEGNSPLLPNPKFAKEMGLANVLIKQCGITHTGSFKDLGMTVLISQLNQMLKLGHKIEAVACASTGDTSAALAAYAAYAGIPSIVFLPSNKISLAQLIQPVSNGSLVLSLDTDFDGCMNIVKEITQKRNIYLANSMNSLRVEGQKTISYEIVQQLGWEVPDHLIIPGGNLGNVSALGKGFFEMKKLGLIDHLPNIIVAQSKKANPLFRWHEQQLETVEAVPAESTLASAIQIGNPVSAKKAIKVLKAVNGSVEQASEEELAEMAAWSDRHGMFNCPHTGVALTALKKSIEKQIISKQDRVVVISTAHGLKFSQFKTDYHRGLLEGKNAFTNPCIELPNDVGKVFELLEKKLPSNQG